MNKKALLVISFGTSHRGARERAITATENVLARAFPAYDLKKAYTSHMIIEKLRTCEGVIVDNVAQAIEKCYQGGYQEVLVQPLHIIEGIEYEMALVELASYANRFERLIVGHPLLANHDDYLAVVEALRDELPKCAPDEGVVFMGHGSRHTANTAYATLETTFKEQGVRNVHIATVEGTPTLGDVIPCLIENGIRKVTLMPFLLVAGDHSQNDMAGNDESWKTILERSGFIVDVRMVGLGEFESIRRVYIAHALAGLKNEGK